jgi:DNA invertase Pin-like site-specific DNA recombinase
MRSKPTTPTITPRYCLYQRVSSASQVEKALSIPEQDRSEREYVAKRGGIVVAVFVDEGIPASNITDRPGMMAMIDAAERREFDVVLTHNSDRLHRSQLDALTTKAALKTYGIKLESVTEPWFGGSDPSDELIEGVFSAFAQWYLRKLSAETKRGIRSAAIHQGRQNGIVPFGYQWLNPDAPREGWGVCAETAAWVQRAFESVVQGASVPDIVREFNTLGVRTQRARNGYQGAAAGWDHSAMYKVLTNRVYIGFIKLGSYEDAGDGKKRKVDEEEFPGAHAAIIDEGLFGHVQTILQRRPAGRAGASDALYTGSILFCPLCAANGRAVPLHHSPYRSRAGERIHRYQCSDYLRRIAIRAKGLDTGQHTCPGYGINEAPVTASLIAILTARAGGPRKVPKSADIASLRDSVLRRSQESNYQLRIDAAHKELSEQPRTRERLLLSQEYMPPDEFRGHLQRLSERARDLEAIVADLERERKREAGITAQESGQVVAFLESAAYTQQQKRDLLRAIIRSITPQPDKTSIEVVFRAASR